jgi:hypothetical protein
MSWLIDPWWAVVDDGISSSSKSDPRIKTRLRVSNAKLRFCRFTLERVVAIGGGLACCCGRFFLKQLAGGRIAVSASSPFFVVPPPDGASSCCSRRSPPMNLPLLTESSAEELMDAVDFGGGNDARGSSVEPGPMTVVVSANETTPNFLLWPSFLRTFRPVPFPARIPVLTRLLPSIKRGGIVMAGFQERRRRRRLAFVFSSTFGFLPEPLGAETRLNYFKT